MWYSCSVKNERRSLAGFIPKGLYGRLTGTNPAGHSRIRGRSRSLTEVFSWMWPLPPIADYCSFSSSTTITSIG
jgi:hypothetical protein